MATHPQPDPPGIPPPDSADAGLPNGGGGARVGDSRQARLQRRLYDHLLADTAGGWAERLTRPQLRMELIRRAQEHIDGDPALQALAEPEEVIEDILDEILGYGPLERLLRDFEISDILINGPRQLYVEKRGSLHPTDIVFRDDEHLREVIRRMIVRTGRQVDENTPVFDGRLPDGSRINVVANPPGLNGPLVSIRRFGLRPLTAEDLLANESLTPEMLEFLGACVKARLNVIISGGTGSGKTTLLNALSRFIPDTERVVTIEDTAELELQQRHVAKMESQPADQAGAGAVPMSDLVRNSLRMRPDRIIVGECRGAETLEMLQVMNTGHEGALTTIHANSTREALTRMELLIGLAGIDIPVWAIRKLIASSINLLVQVTRLPGGKRKIMAISECTGMEGEVVSMHHLFEYVQTGIDGEGGVQGYFRATGIRPRCIQKLKVRGANVALDLFAERFLQPSRNREAGS
jgi:pilus assembly protein CpaF